MPADPRPWRTGGALAGWAAFSVERSVVGALLRCSDQLGQPMATGAWVAQRRGTSKNRAEVYGIAGNFELRNAPLFFAPV